MLQVRPVPCSASASFLWGGSCHSQHLQPSSRAGGAARSAPGVAAHFPRSNIVNLAINGSLLIAPGGGCELRPTGLCRCLCLAARCRREPCYALLWPAC